MKYHSCDMQQSQIIKVWKEMLMEIASDNMIEYQLDMEHCTSTELCALAMNPKAKHSEHFTVKACKQIDTASLGLLSNIPGFDSTQFEF